MLSVVGIVRRRRRSIGFLLCFALASARPAAAQPSDPSREARNAVDAFLTAARAYRWAEAAQWLDMAAFERYFRDRVNTARATLPPPRRPLKR